MKLGINDLKRGSRIAIDGEPYIVMHVKHLHMGRGGATVQSKLKNLRTGKILDRSVKPSDEFEEANIEKMNVEFIYERNGEYWFHEAGKPAKRFSLHGEAIGGPSAFLTPKMKVAAYLFRGDVINVELPVKADFKVVEAPPNVRGNTSQGGSKVVTIETGIKVNVPLFIEEGDVIRINTETGEYTERSK